MSEHLRRFWQTRFAKHGHTGWSDSGIYAHDQLERLAIVSDALEDVTPAPRSALDFGCGSGDFSRLLLRSGLRLWGFDPFVRSRLRDPRFAYISNLDAIIKIPVRLDLILSVTVLDHILDDTELLHTSKVLRSKVGDSGTLFLIEYALDAGSARPASNCQAFRLIAQWHRLLDAADLRITSHRPIPVGRISSPEGFRAFSDNKIAKYIGRISNQRRGYARLARGILRGYARRVFARFGTGSVDQSPLKLTICAPRSHPFTPGATSI